MLFGLIKFNFVIFVDLFWYEALHSLHLSLRQNLTQHGIDSVRVVAAQPHVAHSVFDRSFDSRLFQSLLKLQLPEGKAAEHFSVRQLVEDFATGTLKDEEPRK